MPRPLAILAVLTALATATPARAEPGAIYTFDGAVDPLALRAALAKALASNRDVYVLSGDLGCAPAQQRSFDDDLVEVSAALETGLPFAEDDAYDEADAETEPDDAAYGPRAPTYAADVMVASGVTADVLQSMAPEVNDAVAHRGAIAVLAFCKSTAWLGTAKDGRGQPLFAAP